MNDFTKGQCMFGVGTNFDYYVLKNTSNKQNVIVIDIDDDEHSIDLSKWLFIPSGYFKLYETVLAMNGETKVDVYYSRSMYGTDEQHMNKEKTEKHKYPCCYTITLRDGIKCFYSSEKKRTF